MKLKAFINEKVHSYYWDKDLNCATTTLKILADVFDVDLSAQVIDSAIGMHGAGKFGAQCGLVEGSLMFLGIFGMQKKLSEKEIVDNCYSFALEFGKCFGSLLCRDLRPEGFKSDDPPHFCEGLTNNAVAFTIDYISRRQKSGNTSG